MRMAKASNEEIDRAITLALILDDVGDGNFPRGIDGEFDEEEPTFFDADDPEHLKIFYRRLMDLRSGMFRVTFGFATIMGNDIVDPDKSYLDLHPRLASLLPEEGAEEDGTPV